jgi:hypothetical protein
MPQKSSLTHHILEGKATLHALLLGTTFALLSSLITIAFAQDVELSWEKGTSFVPGSFLSRAPSQIATEKKLPVLILMHGCTGITNEELSWGREIARQGFIVVLPDSMARPNRKSNCDPRLRGASNVFPLAYQYRQQEITYAIKKIQESPWADTKNFFLMGHSEGGIATAQSDHDVWSGQVISGWTCTSADPAFKGIYSPKHIPVLAVAYLDDPWRKGKANEGRCIDSATDRKVVQVDLNGVEHATFLNSTARSAVISFLKSLVKSN